MLEVGQISKVHGVNGRVLVEFYTDLEQRTKVGAEYSTDIGVLTIESSTRHKDRWLIKFDKINTREEAFDSLRLALSAEAIEIEGVTFAHDVIGKELIDQHNENHGKIKSLLKYPASDLLETEDEKLVPSVFIEKFDDKAVYVNVPEGLL